jgi:hypothetical protein
MYEFILPLVTITNLVLAVIIANRWRAVRFGLNKFQNYLKKIESENSANDTCVTRNQKDCLGEKVEMECTTVPTDVTSALLQLQK